MSLFPKCKFNVRLPNAGIRAGERLQGELIIDVPEPIPRAEHLDLVLRTIAIAGYGSGKNRSVVSREMLTLPMHVDFPKDTVLPAGEHKWPFTLDIPNWLPENYYGNDCSIRTSIDLRLDVDWAVDPTASFTPTILMAPITAQGRPITTRSNWSHATLVAEVTLESTVFAQDQPLRGQIALRGGHDARFDALVLNVVGISTIAMARGDRRYGAGVSIRVPKDALVHGESVPFLFPPHMAVSPQFQNGFIDHQVRLRISADIPWASDPVFEIPIQMLAHGSQILLEGAGGPVGATRLRELATSMSAATGLPVGRVPTLVEGFIGAAVVTIADSPRNALMGIDVDIRYPDLDLGLAFRPIGLLDAFRESPLLPTAIGTKYLLRREPANHSPANDEWLKGFVELALTGLERAEDIRFSDHHLGFRIPITDDGTTAMVQLAQFVAGRAKALVDAIGTFPFPPELASAGPAWTATAAEQSAFLVPNGPAIHGIVFTARILGGEVRTMRATIHTVWRKAQPVVVVDLDLHEAPLPETTAAELEKETGFASVRAVLPVIHALTPDRVTLEAPGFIADPHTILPVLEQFFDTVLDARGERRTDSPYR